MEYDDEVGADDITASSVSVALSKVLPGPVVPGLQNCRDILEEVEN